MAAINDDILLDIAAAFGSAVLSPGGWTEALVMTAQRLGSGVTTLEIADLRTGAVRLECPMQVDESAQKLYEDHVYTMNPRTTFGLGSPLGRCIDDGDVPDTPEAGEYFDWLRPSRLRYFQGAKIFDADGVVGFFSSHFSAAHGFPDDTLKRVHQAIIPHVVNALAVGNVLSQTAMKAEALEEATLERGGALALLNARGQIVEASAAFEALLRQGDLLATANRRLVAVRARDRSAVAGFVAQALAGAALEATPALRIARDHGRGIVLRAIPTRSREGLLGVLAPVAMVTAVDLDQPRQVRQQELARLFGLTEREAEITAAIAAGHSAEAIATMLGIGIHTVRQHLKAVFRKLDAANRAEVVRIVAML